MRNYKIKKIVDFIIVIFFSFFSIFIFSQDQKQADRLKQVFKNNTYDRSTKLQVLDDITYYETDTDEIIIYSKELIASAKEMDSLNKQFAGFLQLGNAYRLKSDLADALESYLIALRIANSKNYENEKPNKFKKNRAKIKIALADVYSIMGDNKLSVENYKEAIKILEVENDSINLASAQLNLGDEYYNQKKLDSALIYFEKSRKIFKDADYELGMAYNLGNEGLVYAEQGKEDLAEKSLNEAISVLEKLEDFYSVSVYLDAIADVYLTRGKKRKALIYSKKSLKLAKKYGLKEQISDANLKLSTIYESIGNSKEALKTYKKYDEYKDSVNSVAITSLIKEKDKKFALDKKEQEKKVLEQEAKIQKIINIGIAIVLILIGFLAYFLYKKNKLVVETSKVIEAEKERSDDLLRNILPDETAKELKENGSVKAKRFDEVSVLFTDFKGFTKFSETLSPEELVKTIDHYFSKFDEIMEKHGIEKIKTVGDAYMCASGLPFSVKNHAYKLVKAAFDIIDYVNEEMSVNSESSFDIRIGINSGSVVAGVVGTKKFAYDIWGDTVNTASRMESSGQIGKVNISETTYDLIKGNRAFEFQERGSIEAKGKGKIKMYFVRRTT